MKKKLLSLALVLIIIASAFSLVACNKNTVNAEGAKAFINWMSSEEALTLIGNYGKDKYGETLFTINSDAQKSTAAIAKATKATKVVRISTTTSVNDSGLLAMLEPIFEKKYGYDLQIASAGTGAAIQAAKDGNADMILVHSKAQEEAFIAEGYGVKLEGFAAERITFMHNFFIVAGATADPAGVANAANVKAAFASIASTATPFISRGDNSGTHSAELKLWDKALNINKDGAPASATWYKHAGQGMGACLTMANEQNAYILSDKGTFLSYKKAATDKIPNLKLLFESDNDLKNTYSMIAVNPQKFGK